MPKGLIHIYTGEGKGKTTASVGLAVRAIGHGFKVVYVSFFKTPDICGGNEIKVLEKLGADVFTFSQGMPIANPQITPEEYQTSTLCGLNAIQEFISENSTQLLVLDEILIATKYAYISEEELIDFMDNKPEETELVLTGQGAGEALKHRADYVTVLTKEKHPFDEGIKSRVGIEY